MKYNRDDPSGFHLFAQKITPAPTFLGKPLVVKVSGKDIIRVGPGSRSLADVLTSDYNSAIQAVVTRFTVSVSALLDWNESFRPKDIRGKWLKDNAYNTESLNA